MAPSRVLEKEAPSTSSDESEEEEESEEENEQESEDESVEENPASAPAPSPSPALPDKKSSSKKPNLAPASQPQPKSYDSGSGSDSDSDSDSDSSPEKLRRPSGAADPSIKPLASRPMKDRETAETKKPRSKLGAVAAATKSSVTPKRPAESDQDVKDSKRTKKKDSDPAVENAVADERKKLGDDPKKLFQRVWTEDDEIAILQGLIDYSSEKLHPSVNMDSFYDLIKNSLHLDATRTQFMDKVRRLKKKYENILRRSKKGREVSFSKPHEQKAFELSKKIWGHEGSSGGAQQSKSNRQSKVSLKVGDVELHPEENGAREPKDEEVEDDLDSSLCLRELIKFSKTAGGVPEYHEDFLRQGLGLIGAAKRSQMDEKWRSLNKAGMDLYVRRLNLIQEQMNTMWEAHLASKD